jgi:hypothetical protein
MDCEPFMPDALRDPDCLAGHSNSEMPSQNILLKGRTDSGDPAEFRPHETIRVRAATVGGAARA